MQSAGAQGAPLPLRAADGHLLQGFHWCHPGADATRPVVIVNAATSVRCRHYAPFAAWLHGHGFDVTTYDYRGIGGSRPPTLRGFRAGWLEWGREDFEGVLREVAQRHPGQPIHVVAHSVGGLLVGLAPSSHCIARVFSVGAQYAYWRDYHPRQRLRMLAQWHLAMPLLTAVLGYFPGRRLGWLEDTPSGVVHDWTARHARFEDAWRRGHRRLSVAERQQLVERFAALRAPILALGFSDDGFGTAAAIRRLLDYFRHCERTQWQLAPHAVGEPRLGHFAFFQSRFRERLWPLALDWLRHGRVADAPAGERWTLAAEPAADRPRC